MSKFRVMLSFLPKAHLTSQLIPYLIILKVILSLLVTSNHLKQLSKLRITTLIFIWYHLNKDKLVGKLSKNTSKSKIGSNWGTGIESGLLQLMMNYSGSIWNHIVVKLKCWKNRED